MTPEATSRSGVQRGDSLLDHTVLSAMERLWEGGLSPADLPRIEIGLRAFLTANRLFAFQQDQFDLISGGHDWPYDGTIAGRPEYYRAPFRDGCLEYEFTHPDTAVALVPLAGEESAFLEQLILRELQATAEVAPTARPGGAYAAAAPIISGLLEVPFPLDEEEDDLDVGGIEVTEPVILKHAAEVVSSSASFLIRCHRTGVLVYSDAPIARICNMHLFSEWPRKLFESVALDYDRAMREIRGPGISVELPVLTAVVLSRASHRHKIPQTLRDLREEYDEARRQIWKLLEEMWNAESNARQVKLLSQLQGAATSIFRAAFPERANVLSIALDVASGSITGAAKQLLQQDKPKARVGSVSFAAALARDIRKTSNHHILLKRHLSLGEQREFGLG